MRSNYRPEGIDTSDSEDDEYLEEEIAPLPAKLKERMNRPRASVSAEVYGAYNPKTAFVPPVVEKDEGTKKMLRELLVKIFMFQHLETEDLGTVIDAMEERRFSNGDDVIRQGDDGDELYVCSEGTLECSKIFSGWVSGYFCGFIFVAKVRTPSFGFRVCHLNFFYLHFIFLNVTSYFEYFGIASNIRPD